MIYHIVHRQEDSIVITILPKMIYRFYTIPMKNVVGCLVKIDKLILKFIWKTNDPE